MRFATQLGRALPLLLAAATLHAAQPRASSVDPAVRFDHPWTPIHAQSVARALAGDDVLDLSGAWGLWADPTEPAARQAIASGAPPATMPVPSARIGRGFEANDSALLVRQVSIPSAWRHSMIKLKCEGMLERARVFVNGTPLVDHVGWTPFERDVTPLLRFGAPNRIAVWITMEGYAPPDRLRMRKGGYPDLGGILRPIFLHAVPRAHVLDAFVVPKREGDEWRLETQLTFLNGDSRAETLAIEGELIDATGQHAPLDWLRRSVSLPAGTRRTESYAGAVGAISAWTAETPNLYRLLLHVRSGGKRFEIAERFGFRELRVDGETLRLNGAPIQFRGIAYKGGHADYAGAAPERILRDEVELMKRANVNAVRLGWAFRPPALHRVCDEKGVYVVSSVGPDQYRAEKELAVQQYLEAFMALKNSPSILVWELQNENPRVDDPAYHAVMDLGRAIDPQRLFIHPGASHAGLDLVCTHYQPRLFAADKRDGRPFLPTEYAHVPAYELDRMKFDPGIHELWGYALKRGWDFIREAPWVVGAMTFAWRDPYYRDGSGQIVPALHNEARWGVVDELFRPKPEYHHLFKVYSPIRLSTQPLDLAAGAPSMRIENRFDFTDLASVRAQWSLLGPKGLVRSGEWKLQVPPRASAIVPLPQAAIPSSREGDRLELSFSDPDGRLIQRDVIPYLLDDQTSASTSGGEVSAPLQIREEASLVTVSWPRGSYRFDKALGMLRWAALGEESLLLSGPELNQRVAFPRASWELSPATRSETRRVVPLAVESFAARADESGNVDVRVTRRYSTGVMETNFHVLRDGTLRVTCTLPPQAYGVSWRIPVTGRSADDEASKQQNRPRPFIERVSWRHNGLWSWYPDGHVGANAGVSRFVTHNDLAAHDPQNHAMRFNTAFMAVGPADRALNLVLQDPQALMHVQPYFWYNELELFVQGRPEDDYDYFDRTGPLEAMPHALSEKERTFSFQLRLLDRSGLDALERRELDPAHVLIERARFWARFRAMGAGVPPPPDGTVQGLPAAYPE